MTLGTEDRLKKKQERLKTLCSSCAQLEQSFQQLCKELNISREKSPDTINHQHICDLKLYNELRDTGLRLVQMVADEKQCKLRDVFDEIGYDMKD